MPSRSSIGELTVDRLRPGRLSGQAWVTLAGPGGAIMVAYGADETERALRRRVPAAATPLGLALLRAGCRWLKDWYFAEGGREGHTKLQGELPLDATHRRRGERALHEELETFVAPIDGTPVDQRRAREALAFVGAGRPGAIGMRMGAADARGSTTRRTLRA